MKKVIHLAFLLFAFFALPSFVRAHVTVRPNEAGVATFQTFTVAVPSEKDIPTVSLRLIIPEGLEHVTPNVKPGWRIETKTDQIQSDSQKEKHGDGRITEIIWSGGSIPAGQRDEFLFSAKVPANETILVWKAYQTYSDGSIVSWDLDPAVEQPKSSEGTLDFSKSGPYSQTKIINDLKSSDSTNNSDSKVIVEGVIQDNLAVVISVAALLISIASLGIHIRRK